MKIGIFMGGEYFHSEQLRKEGLIRLVAVLLEHLKRKENLEPVLLCSKLSQSALKSAFSDINDNLLEPSINFLNPRFVSPFYYFSWKKKEKTRQLSSLPSICFNKLKKMVGACIRAPRRVKLIFFPLYLFLKICVIIPLYQFRKVINNRIATSGHRELLKLVRVANQSDCELIFVPTIFYPEVLDIRKPVVLTVPDLVVFHYPQYYYDKTTLNLSKTLKLLDNTRYFTTYSQYVADLSIRPFSNGKIKVIRHGGSLFLNQLDTSGNTQNKAVNIINNRLRQSENIYLRLFDISNVKFIVYTSQNRPHKNILSLIKAYNTLLRKKFCNIKLILTGRIEEAFDAEIAQYIKQHNLAYDVISLPNLSNLELASLVSLACLAVNPTLFEGGFPFTFTEGYSVNTPSVMSKIPVTLEIITDEDLQQIMLFDPYNIEDMVEKIHWGITHREQLLNLQKPLYEKLCNRSWDTVADEYVEYFNEILAENQEKTEETTYATQ